MHISVDLLQNPAGFGIATAAIIVIGGVLKSHLQLAFLEDFEFGVVYVGWVFLALLAHVATASLWRNASEASKLHLHHWYWAFLAAHFPIFDSALSCLSQAAFLGIYVHGAACFGLESIFETLPVAGSHICNTEDSQKSKHI